MATDQDPPFEELDLEALDPEARREAIRAHMLVSLGRALGISDETQLGFIAAHDAGHDYNREQHERLKASAEADGLEWDIPFEQMAEDTATTAELDHSRHYQRAVQEHNRARNREDFQRTKRRLAAIKAVTRKRVRHSRRPRSSNATPRRPQPIVSTDCSTRESSSSRSSGTDPGADDDPELPTGPGALCHCGCGRILPANKRSHAKWFHPENCRNKFARNAPEQCEPRRDTREPDEIQADIDAAVARRASLWRLSGSRWVQLSPQQRREAVDLEDKLSGKSGLWAELRIAKASRLPLERSLRSTPGAPLESAALRGPGRGNRRDFPEDERHRVAQYASEHWSLPRADRQRAQSERALRESGRPSVAEEIEAWRRRRKGTVAEFSRSATVVDLAALRPLATTLGFARAA